MGRVGRGVRSQEDIGLVGVWVVSLCCRDGSASSRL